MRRGSAGNSLAQGDSQVIVHEGFIAAFNYAIGPALIYESERSLRAIQTTGDPYIVIVPDTIPPRAVCSTDWRRVRGFVLARCEKDNLFTAFVIHQRRAAVRCVPAVLDDVREGRIRNGEPIAVDGVDGKVFVQPDAETIARFEALRLTPQPRVTKEYFPRLAREALQTANVPEIPPLPPRPELPDMLLRDSWQVAPGPNPMPKDVPTPADIRREGRAPAQSCRIAVRAGCPGHLAGGRADAREHVPGRPAQPGGGRGAGPGRGGGTPPA